MLPMGTECLSPGNEPVLLERTGPTAHAHVPGPQNQETVNILILCNPTYSKAMPCGDLAF